MIRKIDHLVITTASPKECLEFYVKLGFEAKAADGRHELYAGDFKINVHTLNKELTPHAQNIRTGSADLCFEIDGSIEDFKAELQAKGVPIELGTVPRTGVRGKMLSIYLWDIDGNLLEFSQYV